MIGYIFSFAMGFGIALLLSAVYFYKKEFNIAGRLLVVPVSATLINLIYFYEVFSTMSGRVSLSDPRKNGLFYTHEPLLNLISIATLLFIIVCFLFFYKKDTYSENDPFGIETINSNAKYQVVARDNVMPYVNFAWSIGYRF